jgi:predicted Zn-dependent protease
MPEARAARNRLADLVPGEPHVLCTFGQAELSSGSPDRFEMAAKDALRAAKLEPNCVLALTLAGDISMDRGDQKAGLEYLKRAVKLKPEDVPLTLHYINRLLEANDLAGALAVARGVTERYPGYAQGYVLMAMAGGQYPPASPEARATEGLLLKALRLDPTNALAHVRLGNLYLKAADFARAVPHLEAGRLLRYDQASLLFNLAEAYRRTGRTAEADRVQQSFQKISRLDNELSALDKQSAASPMDTSIKKRRSEVRAALERAKQVFNEPDRPSPAMKRELPPGMTGGETR